MTHKRSVHFWRVTLITCTIENLYEFRGFAAIHDSFLREIGGNGIFLAATPSEQSAKFSLQKYFFQFTKVLSLESFPLCGIQAVTKTETN